MSAKYMLSARPPFSPDWCKSFHPTFASALGAAGRKYNREWSVDSITNGPSVVINSEGLMQAFTRMDELKRETPKRPLDEVSEQVIRGKERDGSE
ncbi:MAG: hypothetical protein M3R15_14125 [Acidobacteriota bacterium]|nr:hypothetical protein [Acidobacteriota bacterium]